MFDKVKLSNFEKMKEVVVLDDLYFLTVGLQNVLLLLAVVEELNSTTFFFLFFFSRQNRILSRKQILTYIGRVGPKETDYSA